MSKKKVKQSKKPKAKVLPKTNKGYIGKQLGVGIIKNVVNSTLPSSVEYKVVTTDRGQKYILSVRDLNKQIK